MVSRKVVIVTGELSGETHAAHLVTAVKASHPVHFSGIGSTALAASGVEVFHDYRNISVTGLTEVLGKAGHIRHAYKALKSHLISAKPHLVILVDFPDFNLGLAARAAKRLGIPVVYFIPPQVWAWRKGRIRQIKSRIDLVLSILPFEEALYRSHAVPVVYVGHPYARSIKESRSREDFLSLVNADRQGPIITMMPGSRINEVKRHLPVFLQVAERLDRELDRYTILLPVADSLDKAPIDSFIKRRKNIILVKGFTHDCLKHSDVALVKSGSSTLEAAVLGVPSVVLYKMSYLSYLVGRIVVKGPYISLPNIIAGKAVFPEFIQSCDPGLIAKSLISMLKTEVRSKVQRELDSVRDKLGTSGPDPYETAAKEIVRFLEQRYGPLSQTP